MILVQRVLASLTSIGVATQFFLAGAGTFGALTFDPHRTLGFVLIGLAAAGLAAALFVRRFMRNTGLLVALLLAQWGLARGAIDSSGWFGALHGLNALAVMAAAGILARRTWEGSRA
jgi:GNAT superfamily N-acetyltransferase